MTRDEALVLFKNGYYYGLSVGLVNLQNETIPKNELRTVLEIQQCDEIINKIFDDFCSSNNIRIDNHVWNYK